MLVSHTPFQTPSFRRHGRPPARHVAFAVLAAVTLPFAAACSSDDATDDATTTDTDAGLYVTAPLDDVDATARELAQRFVDILSSDDPQPQLEEFLSPAFLLARASGEAFDKADYLENSATIESVTILDDGFRAVQDGAVLSAYFKMNVNEVIDGESVDVTEVFRLGSFIHTVDGWQLVTWSNFNPLES
jgi:hypothetical protein